MSVSRAVVPAVAGLLALAGALVATLALFRAADAALDRVLDERLRGAGEAAAGLLSGVEVDEAHLRGLVAANGLEGAYVVSPALVVLADAGGHPGHRADLLRTDPARVTRALRGEVTVAFAYAVGAQAVATAYFPIRSRDGAPAAVLALEAGQSFAAGKADLRRAFAVAVALSLLGAVALAVVVRRWARAEGARRQDAERAIRGDALARMGAMVAHEIRNPLGVIRGAAELIGSRAGAALGERDREALQDVVAETERLRRLTEDFLDLARDPAIVTGPVDVSTAVAEAARSVSRTHAALEIHVEGEARAEADPGRLRQVLANLLVNAAQAGARNVWVRAEHAGGGARLVVRDDGPGIDPALRPRLFEPFATGRAQGSGLGLALSRRIVERQGGSLRLDDGASGPGAVFELRLPAARG